MIEVATQTLGINAAFLNEIKQDHVELRQLLAKARRAVDEPQRKTCSRELCHLFLSILDRLAIHFSLEEAYGYFEDALEIAPRLSAQAESLRSEHETLFLAFREIVECAERLVYHESPISILANIATQFNRFDAKLARHEQREMELILEAFDDDVGVGD